MDASVPKIKSYCQMAGQKQNNQKETQEEKLADLRMIHKGVDSILYPCLILLVRDLLFAEASLHISGLLFEVVVALLLKQPIVVDSGKFIPMKPQDFDHALNPLLVLVETVIFMLRLEVRLVRLMTLEYISKLPR